MSDKGTTRLSPELVVKAWSDEEFLKALLSKPEDTLRAEGYDVPDGFSIKFHLDSPEVVNLVIPAKPQSLKIGDIVEVAAARLEAQLEMTF